MAKYYKSKKASKSRGWMRRNMGRAGSALKKRYYSGGKLSLAKVASDAKYALSIAKTAKGLLNTEKKRYEFNFYDQTVGQVQANGSGAWSQEITPAISQGTGYGNRVGGSISLRSMFIKLQMWQQSAATSPMKIDFYVVETNTGDAFDITTFMQYNKYLYAVNTVAIYDTHCQRDPDNFANFKVLRRKTFYLSPDRYSGQTIAKDATVKLNFGRNGKHIRFENNSNSTTTKRFWLVALASCGNKSTTNNSTLSSLAQTAMNTGAYLQVDGCQYFIDN